MEGWCQAFAVVAFAIARVRQVRRRLSKCAESPVLPEWGSMAREAKLPYSRPCLPMDDRLEGCPDPGHPCRAGSRSPARVSRPVREGPGNRRPLGCRHAGADHQRQQRGGERGKQGGSIAKRGTNGENLSAEKPKTTKARIAASLCRLFIWCGTRNETRGVAATYGAVSAGSINLMGTCLGTQCREVEPVARLARVVAAGGGIEPARHLQAIGRPCSSRFVTAIPAWLRAQAVGDGVSLGPGCASRRCAGGQ